MGRVIPSFLLTSANSLIFLHLLFIYLIVGPTIVGIVVVAAQQSEMVPPPLLAFSLFTVDSTNPQPIPSPVTFTAVRRRSFQKG
jgi:hypothetical protein